jgi:hypothetical protein
MGIIAMGFRRIGFVVLVRCFGEMIINNKILYQIVAAVCGCRL